MCVPTLTRSRPTRRHRIRSRATIRRMRHHLLFSVFPVLSLLAVACATTHAPGAPEGFRAQLDEDWKYWMAQYPETATAVGYPGQNARWTDYSQPAIDARAAYLKNSVQRIADIDRASLTAEDQVSYDLYRDLLQTAAQGLEFHNDAMPIRGVVPHNLRMPINQIEGVQQDVPSVIAQMPTATRADYENIVARLEGVGPLVDQTIALMEQGMADRLMPPRITFRDVPDQVKAQIVDDPLQQPAARRVQDMAVRHPRGRPRRIDDARDERIPAVGGAGVRQTAHVPDDTVSARVSRHDSRQCAAERRRDVRLQRAMAYDDREDAKRDPRDRTRRGAAHSCRDGRRHAVVRLQGQLRRVQAVSAHRVRSSSSPTRVAAVGLPRHRQARRSRAGAPVRPPAADAVRRQGRARRDRRRRRRPRTTTRDRSPPDGRASCSRTPTSSTRGRGGRWKR